MFFVLWVFTAAAVAPVHEHSGHCCRGIIPGWGTLARDRFAVGSCDVVVVLGVGKGRVMLAVPCVMLPVSWVSICLSSHLWVWYLFPHSRQGILTTFTVIAAVWSSAEETWFKAEPEPRTEVLVEHILSDLLGVDDNVGGMRGFSQDLCLDFTGYPSKYFVLHIFSQWSHLKGPRKDMGFGYW